VDEHKIAKLQSGHCPIHEPGLPELIEKNLKIGRLQFTSNLDQAVAHGFYQFIAVGTPQDEDGSADLRHVLAVAKTIGEKINEYRVVIIKSTVPVGTADKVRNTIENALSQRKMSVEFDVVSNPEFLREGAAIDDFMNSDRIIIGVANQTANNHMRLLYAPFNRNQDRLISMNIRSAELTKYAANSILATKISFMNELSQLAELLDADIERVRIGIGSDPRIGYHFINPGCGYGGSCFPKDLSALESMANQLSYEPQLIKAAQQVNHAQKRVLFNKILRHFNHDLTNKVIALWGLAFKPNTDDMREAPSRVLMEALWQAGACIQAYDPAAISEAERIYGHRKDLKFCTSAEQALQGADVLAIVTEWSDFLSPDFAMIKQSLKQPTIFDGRNLYDPEFMSQLGFSYYAIGRGTKLPVNN
jgi:UDPglucose 6-dehydrogenase